MAKKRASSQSDAPPRPKRKIAEKKPPAEKPPRVILPAEVEEEETSEEGVRCPSCGCGHCPVYYTRNRLNRRIRKRNCRHCGRGFVTTEKVNG